MYLSLKYPFMNGCCPQLSLPTCSHTYRTSPPIVMYQSSALLRKGMYLIGSQKSWRRLGSRKKLQSSSSFSNLYVRSGVFCFVAHCDFACAVGMARRETSPQIARGCLTTFLRRTIPL